MRATISFEIDLDQVEGTMGLLISQEAHNLRAAADILEDYSGPRDNLLEEVTQVLHLLDEGTTQLRQYQNMMANFEKAKFETILPQPAGQPVHSLGQLQQAMEGIKGLEGFLEGITAQEEVKEDGSAPEEG